MVQNKGLIFRKVPEGFPVPGQDLVIETSDFDLEQAPPEGGVTVKSYYASFDPYQRGRMRPAHIKSYTAAFELGKPIHNRSIIKVIKSDNPKFQPGDVLASMETVPIQEYSALGKEWTDKARKLDNPYNLDPKVFLGALGMPGLTAWSSLYEIGKPQKGETIFISAASGAVGQLVGQLAKHEGLKVFGSVGDDKKLDYILKDLGFDGGFNYKKEKPADALNRLAPDGLDIYYENVGGEQLEAAINAMKPFGRIVACGMISQYNSKPEDLYPIKNLMNVVSKRLTMRGFIVSDPDMGPPYYEDMQKKLQKWIHEGSFTTRLHVTDGIDHAADGFVGMLKGDNFGKAVLKIADLE